MNLKELRAYHGLKQVDIAKIINKGVPEISNYENNIWLPALEDMMTLEQAFNTSIEFNEDITPIVKHNVVQSIIVLAEHYPLAAVLEFAARVYRRESDPNSIIIAYSAEIDNGIEPLLPTGIDFDK